VESYGDDPFLDAGLRTALERTADVFFFVTISAGALGLAGLVLPPLDGRRLFFLLALLALAGVPLAFFGDTRFHVPAMPLLVVAAAWAVLAAIRTAPKLAQGAVPSTPGGRAASPPGGTFGSLEGRSEAEAVAEGEASVADPDALEDA